MNINEKDIEIKYKLLSLGKPKAFNNTIFEVKKIKLTQKKVQIGSNHIIWDLYCICYKATTTRTVQTLPVSIQPKIIFIFRFFFELDLN